MNYYLGYKHHLCVGCVLHQAPVFSHTSVMIPCLTIENIFDSVVNPQIVIIMRFIYNSALFGNKKF